MNREEEINQRLAALDYRSPLAVLLGEDVRYYRTTLETERQRRAEEVIGLNAQLAIIESVNHSLQERASALEAENSELKARFLNAITEGHDAPSPEQVPASQEASGIEEPAPVDGGSVGGLEPVDGQEEPAN